MKKLVMEGPKKSKLIDVEKPKITSADQALIKLKYCGVCRSENYDWAHAEPEMTFGHEPIGVIEEIGADVKNLKVGSRVSGLFYGGAQYAVANCENIFEIPDDIKDEEAVLEPLGCLISAVSKVKIPVVGDKVAVVGCGYMGCGAISLLSMRGAHVVGIDTRRECLEYAKRYGAKEVFTPEEFLKSFDNNFVSSGVGTWNGSSGFPLVMEWAETDESLDFAINITSMCGQLAIGAYHTGEKRLVDVQQLNVKAIDCLSTHPREWDLLQTSCARALELFEEGWNFRHVPTKIYPITQFDKAQEELTGAKYGKWIKSLVDWTKSDGEAYIID